MTDLSKWFKSPSTVSYDVNLLPKDPFFDTFLGKTLKWALSAGHYIVIFTQLAVILTFLARFGLDRQLTDLNRSIEQKKTIIGSYGNLETEIRATQRVLEEYQQLSQQSNITEIFPVLTRIFPPDTGLERMTIKPESIELEGSTLTQNSLNLLINNIQLVDTFFNVSVDRIESGEESQQSGFSFVIRADTKEFVSAEANFDQPGSQEGLPF
ncbi:MAG: hypothetical protein COU69_03385 [Candidatus Pacebacteria bacterium CG10_big_fil_rev_8_21_14_0_10_56_10]|nr:MAG: hypothetical protein COU69_03385 [Candidatus Pacebacteria bacterium CG10_big_fil_rev_8_21_14_0_10_56_10]